MSMISAPSSTARSTAASASASPKVAPESKKESGVRLTIAMTTRSAGPKVRVPSRSGPPGRGSVSTTPSLPEPTPAGSWHDSGVLLAVEVVVVAVIVFVVAALAVGRLDRMSPAPQDGPWAGLPSGSLSAVDVTATRFDMAFRGYRMSEVDAVLARLADELAWRDDELARRDEELVKLATFAQVDRGGTGPAGGLPGRPADHNTDER
jgi:DivIVA domain-containing protein